MIVCLCNALSHRVVIAAAARGATCCKAVWEHCGCRPDCGACGATIRQILDVYRTGAAAGQACAAAVVTHTAIGARMSLAGLLEP